MKTPHLHWALPLIAVLLVVGCTESIDTYERASIVIICKPGDSIGLVIWRPDADPNKQTVIRDTIRRTKRYDGLRIGQWEAITQKLDTLWRGKKWTFDLKVGRIDTADMYKGD